MSISLEHPLSKPQHLSACTVAALFWGVGVAMIDPRIGIGILLCVVGIALTCWIYWGDFMAIPKTSIRKWPWLAFGFVAIEVLVPSYMLYAKADEPNAKTSIEELIAKGLCPPGTTMLFVRPKANNGNSDGFYISKDSHVCLIDPESTNNKGKGYNVQ